MTGDSGRPSPAAKIAHADYMTYLPTIIFGGLMSDRQMADARAHAEILASRLTAETPQPDTGETSQ